ncbi:hypothetical protein [Pseudonocardia acaciae]|uniref:hypothetical protein n=1 Tax=Pseudonocardia acaciae TaxID=551276 RepID=UPI00056ACBC1|nr:hypothetical protein [Pseudonocardia acaciae]
MGADDRLPAMLNVARYHRAHERYHSLLSLEDAVALRRDANSLQAVADRLRDDAPPTTTPPGGAGFAAMGCTDLSDASAVTSVGILFMEGEGEPPELAHIRRRFTDLSRGWARSAGWLAEKMDAGWARERALLEPELVDAARPRFAALTRTTAAAHAHDVAARLLDTSAAALSKLEFTPAAVRSQRRYAASLLRTAAWLATMAAGVIADEGATLGLSDPDWTAYIDELEARVE